MKKLLRMLLSLAVCLSLTIPASADGYESCSFADVSFGSYYDDAVLWACENGITNGVTESAFAPAAAVDRGQVMTLLYRAMGSPGTQSGSQAFSDVSIDAYYYHAASWAVSNGIAEGIGNGVFSPDTACTRAQIVTLLYRCMK